MIVNVGPRGGQTVFHLHWHVLGGDSLPGIRMTLIADIESELKDGAPRARRRAP